MLYYRIYLKNEVDDYIDIFIEELKRQKFKNIDKIDFYNEDYVFIDFPKRLIYTDIKKTSHFQLDAVYADITYFLKKESEKYKDLKHKTVMMGFRTDEVTEVNIYMLAEKLKLTKSATIDKLIQTGIENMFKQGVL